ncbi:hypothetical protein D7X98_04050 [bacterium 1XD8-76]|nr:hypothetical protein D7X98_04050 [bacterium 1XD8-76]
MKSKERRMRSFVARGNKLINEGKTPEGMKMIERGLQYYSDRVLNAINPHAKEDTVLMVLVLHHLINEMDKCQPGVKELADKMSKCIVFPALDMIVKIKKMNEE